MTQDQLFNELAERTGMKKKEAEGFYNHLADILKEELNADEETKATLPGIGTMTVKRRDAYTGRNPHTGADVPVAASRRISMKFFPKFKAELNK